MNTCKGCDTSQPGLPSPIYQTVKEVNADASKFGDLLLGGGFRFASSYNTGFNSNGQLSGPVGDTLPGENALVMDMTTDLLVSVFLPRNRLSTNKAFLFIVSKSVSSQLAPVEPRNVTLLLHPCITAATVITPGRQGRTGFDLGAGIPEKTGKIRRHFASVDEVPGIKITIELVGGGGGLVEVAGKDANQVEQAAYSKAELWYEPGGASLAGPRQGGPPLKAPEWAFGTFKGAGRPLNNLEVEDGMSFEGGEQTPFIIGGSLALEGGAPLTGPAEAQSFALAGYNLLSLQVPRNADAVAFGHKLHSFFERRSAIHLDNRAVRVRIVKVAEVPEQGHQPKKKRKIVNCMF